MGILPAGWGPHDSAGKGSVAGWGTEPGKQVRPRLPLWPLRDLSRPLPPWAGSLLPGWTVVQLVSPAVPCDFLWSSDGVTGSSSCAISSPCWSRVSGSEGGTEPLSSVLRALTGMGWASGAAGVHDVGALRLAQELQSSRDLSVTGLAAPLLRGGVREGGRLPEMGRGLAMLWNGLREGAPGLSEAPWSVLKGLYV